MTLLLEALASEETARPAQVLVAVPAHNEAACIAATIRSLQSQTHPPDRIVVVCDNCTDDTEDIAIVHGVETFCTVDNHDKKAGGLNQLLVPMIRTGELGPTDRIMVMDADTELAPDFVEVALSYLEGDEDRPRPHGAVSAAYVGKESIDGLVPLVQKLEYMHERHRVRRRSGRVSCLSGTATVLTVAACERVLMHRSITLPGSQYEQLYLGISLTEDFEITLALKRLGFDPVSPQGLVAYTDLMPDLRMLWSQRLRWQRGTLETLRLYGLDRLTYRLVLLQAWTYAVSTATPTMLALWVLSLGVLHSPLQMSWWIVLLLPLSAADQLAVVWPMRNWRRRLLAVALVPMFVFDQFRSAVYWWALFKALRKTEFVWK